MVCFSSRGLAAAAACALLAGCGATSPAAPPARPLATAPALLSAPSGQSVSNGTLYAAESHVVHAYPLGADGTTAAARTIVPHPNEDQYITGLAVNGDGTLDILEQYYPGGVETLPGYCRVVVESATADGAARAVGTHLCAANPTIATNGIATNTFGGYDVLYYGADGILPTLRRFGSDGASIVSSLPLNTQPQYFGTDHAGRDYLPSFDGTNSRLQIFKSTTTDYTQTKWDVTFIGYDFGPAAVSPAADRSVYVVSGYVGNEYINVIVPGATTVSGTIGPFRSNRINVMAVDAQGSLYVALSPSNGAPGVFINVYPSGASGKPPPQRTIIPSPSIPGPITALAIAN
jgi:hypothetical protein